MRDDTSRLNEFAPVTTEAWRQVVDRDLKGADFERRLVKQVAEGVRVGPLYTRADTSPDASGLPGQAPFVRGPDHLGKVQHGWDVRSLVRHAHVEEAAAVLQEELATGARSVRVQLDSGLCVAESHGDGVIASGLGAFERLFEGVNLEKVPIALDASSGGAIPAAAVFFALAQRQGVPPRSLTGWLYTDPLGQLARTGALPVDVDTALDELGELARYCARTAPRMRAVVVCTAPYHDAGADAVAELSLGISTGIVYLRNLLNGGILPNEAAQQIGFDFSVGRDLFVEIAKLRAARKLWARVVEVAGAGSHAQAMRMHVRGSARTKTVRDPWVNLLRGTAETFAAAVAGADSVETSPLDVALGQADTLARRLARNTQTILQQESHLHRVVDPAGGSWYVERLTQQLADAAWAQMQRYEAEGGVTKALLNGEVAESLAASAARDAASVSRGKLPVTGVSAFPNLSETPLERPGSDVLAAIDADRTHVMRVQAGETTRLAEIATRADRMQACVDAAGAGATLMQLRNALGRGEGTRIHALPPSPYAAGFEALRDRSDSELASGGRPRVFLANLGSLAEHKARAAFATHFFEAGGLESVGNDGFANVEAAAGAFAQSGTSLVCLCSSDKQYAEHAVAAARALRAKGARAIVLAGKPNGEEALREAGFTHFIYMGSDALETLGALHDLAGEDT